MRGSGLKHEALRVATRLPQAPERMQQAFSALRVQPNDQEVRQHLGGQGRHDDQPEAWRARPRGSTEDECGGDDRYADECWAPEQQLGPVELVPLKRDCTWFTTNTRNAVMNTSRTPSKFNTTSPDDDSRNIQHSGPSVLSIIVLPSIKQLAKLQALAGLGHDHAQTREHLLRVPLCLAQMPPKAGGVESHNLEEDYTRGDDNARKTC
mmetsp:Transcript_85886/g.223308  ORF Transcript_85886/g.223308 Transcript_85886/m.223308 type:complete len:208 (+) Transcript_85886:227-850(+)